MKEKIAFDRDTHTGPSSWAFRLSCSRRISLYNHLLKQTFHISGLQHNKLLFTGAKHIHYILTAEVATLCSTQEDGVYQRRAPTPAIAQLIRHRYPHTSSASFSLLVPTHCVATLFLNSLSFCCACSTNLSTAYPNLSFFPLNCFSLNASRLVPPSPPPFPFTLTFTPPLPLAPIPDARPSPILPSSSSLRAMRACSRRESLSR